MLPSRGMRSRWGGRERRTPEAWKLRRLRHMVESVHFGEMLAVRMAFARRSGLRARGRAFSRKDDVLGMGQPEVHAAFSSGGLATRSITERKRPSLKADRRGSRMRGSEARLRRVSSERGRGHGEDATSAAHRAADWQRAGEPSCRSGSIRADSSSGGGGEATSFCPSH